MPIKDVLNYKKGNKLKDSVITQGEKDGKYVITQQLNHEDFAGDTYIEFSAPDQNSKITGIRVYYEPLTFNFTHDILQSNKLNPLTLAALKAVNLDVSSYGKVNGGMLDTTGFRLDLEGEVFCIEFRTYRDKNGCLVALAKFHGEEYITDDVKYWHFSNGELKETEPAFDSKYSDYYNWAKGDGGMNFDPDGIFFLLSEDDQLFQWNGEKFEPGRRKYSYEEEE
jgi:hypothetical protein